MACLVWGIGGRRKLLHIVLNKLFFTILMTSDCVINKN